MSYKNPSDDAYGAGWNGSTKFPTQNTVYDKIETVVASIPAAQVPGTPTVAQNISTNFEDAARFATILNSGTNTFDNSGFGMDTTATTTRAAGITWDVVTPVASGGVFIGSPVFSASFCFAIIGTTGSSYFGLGLVTKTGAGHTYTTDHAGFKVTVSGSVATLFATQGDGATEAASSALTTLTADDQIDILLKMNGSSSIDYYWQKNGGGWSAATNLTGNMPAAVATGNNRIQFSVSNNTTATRNLVFINGSSFAR